MHSALSTMRRVPTGRGSPASQGAWPHRTRRRVRLAMTALGAVVVLLGSPLRATAHSYLVSSTPADGAQLGLAPAAVRLEFSEALNPALSSANVTDGAGHTVGAQPDAEREIRVDLVTNVPGSYQVRWTAVSGDDGHTTSGSFGFTVEAQGGSAQSGGSGAGPSAADVAIAVGRGVEDTALLLAVGMLLIGWLGRGSPALAWARPRLRPIVILALLGGCAVVSSEAAVASGGSLSGAVSYLDTGLTGSARAARVALELYAIAAVSRGGRYLWPAVTAPVVALAASGHASGNAPQLVGIGLDAAHLVSAGMWAGGIIAMATLRPPEGWRASGVPLLRAFTPWALGAFTATVALGIGQAILDVGGLAALTGTTYGRVLLAKSAAVALMIPFSLAAWRLRRPRMRTEAGLGVAVVAAAALLASSPVPARGITASASTAQPPAGAVGLPHGSDLTLADHAGGVLLGVTITPARPGANQLTIYALAPGGASAGAGLDISAAVDTAPTSLTRCGDPCRSANVTLQGGESVRITVAGPQGGSATLAVPSLPAADGTAVLEPALARMHALHTFAMHEALTSGGPTVITDYTAAAPDRLAYTQPSGFASVIIGATRYDRQGPTAPWTAESIGSSIPEPVFVWDSFAPYKGVHVLGTATASGVPVTLVGFFGGDAGTPVWFRLSIDDQGFVRRAEMRAPGHFMDQSFHDFDAPAAITAPAGAIPLSSG